MILNISFVWRCLKRAVIVFVKPTKRTLVFCIQELRASIREGYVCENKTCGVKNMVVGIAV